MPYREAPPRIVPRVFCDDGGGYSRPAKCVHCGRSISKRALAWGRLVSDPEGMSRPVHIECAREYSLFCRALSI